MGWHRLRIDKGTDMRVAKRGTLYLWQDQGMEWAEYAFQDAEHIHRAADGRERWSYDGLHVVGEGDWLRVFHPDGERIEWEGRLSFRPRWWVRWLRRAELVPRGLDPARWESWFVEQRPAELLSPPG